MLVATERDESLAGRHDATHRTARQPLRRLRPDGHGGWRSEPAQGLSSSSVSRIVSTGKGLVALGGDEHGALLWSSTDGTSWHALDLPAEVAASGTSATLTGAAVAGGRAYLTGQVLSPGGDRSMGALWTGAASLLAP